MKLRLAFPVGLGEQLERMAAEREMKIEDLIEELVEVAIISLRDPPPSLDGWARDSSREPEHHDPTR